MMQQTTKVLSLASLLSASLAHLVDLPEDDCSWFQDVGCTSGDQTNVPSDWSNKNFQTPLDSTLFNPAYGLLSCYSSTQYAAGLQSAQVEVACRTHSDAQSVQYRFGDSADWQDSNTFQADGSSVTGDNLQISIKASTASNGDFVLDLDPINFVWQNNQVPQGDEYKNGQKGGIVEMFGWPFADVEKECAHLGQAGWMGVKLFPVSEHVFSYEWPQSGELNPWWFYYQPVSYKMEGRHGSRDELRSLIQTCRAAGVRVYADAVINHMSGGGNDVIESHRNGGSGYCNYWGPKNSTGSSPYYTHSWDWKLNSRTGQEPGMEYPGAGYTPVDFHCDRGLNSWSDPFQLNYGWLSGLSDLDTESEFVRERIAAYITDLIGIGFSGHRIDAAKHIKPESLTEIIAKVKRNLGGELPADYITWMEVLIGGEKDLLMCDDGDYNYGKSLQDKLSTAGLSDADVNKIKIWESAYPKEMPICGYWVVDAQRFAIQNDCHDDQNPGSSSRDMGDKGSVLVREKDVNKHRQFEELLFNRNDADWDIRIVLSSYSFMNNGAMGPPDGKSDCSACIGDQCDSCSKSMPFSQAYDENSCGYDCEVNGSWQEGVYTRVHRDYDIIQAMRNFQGLPTVTDASQLGLPSNCGSSYASKTDVELIQ